MIRFAAALAATLATVSLPLPATAQRIPKAPAADADPVALAARVADWQLARMGDVAHVSRETWETRNPRAWEQAAFWVGMTALADAGGPPRMRAAVLAMGRANDWTPAKRPFHADDLAITAPYIWAAEHGAGAAALAPTRRAFDNVVANTPDVSLALYVPPSGYEQVECLVRWCWCDALFMAPPAMTALTKATGDAKYRDFAMREFWATKDFLYDPAEKLFYRDSRFFERRDANGRKLFWSRGNGWVFAGMARIIPTLSPGSPDRRRMEALFRDMAAKLARLQKPDGYWAPSLLSPEGSPPESSGTGFYTAGMAWGVRTGLLPHATYAPVAQRGWAALVRAVQPDGRIGWVQQVSDRPEKVEASDTQFYGAGAFLLAASEMARLAARR